MSDKSLFPSGVKVSSEDLQNVETQRDFQDKQRLTDLAITGVASGLAVTINGTSGYLVDVAAGSGYTANGEFVELETTVAGVRLSDYTNGAINLVGLVYTETESRPKPHETDGNRYNTRASRSYRLVVYTSADYLNLDATNDDLSLDALDRFLILAYVTARGDGAPPTVLDSISIVSSGERLNYDNPYAAVFTTSPVTITGVEIVSVQRKNSTTALPPIGNGSLALAVGSSATAFTLTWTAAGDVAGSGVDVSAGGTFTVYSGASTLSGITVIVTTQLLPTVDATYTNTVQVKHTLYDTAEQVLSAKDRAHRARVGFLAPSTTNPHGIRGSDISTVLHVGQGAVFGESLPNSIAGGLVPRRTTIASTAPTRSLMDAYSGGSSGFVNRVYRNSSGVLELSVNARWGGTTWIRDAAGAASLTAFWNNAVQVSFKESANTGTPWASWDEIGLNLVVGTSLYSGLPFEAAPTAALTPRFITNTASSAARWLVHQANDPVSGGYRRTYLTRTSDGITGEEIVLNAKWNGSAWERDVSGQDSYHYSFNTEGFVSSFTESATSSPFASWDTAFARIANAPNTNSGLTNGRLDWGTGGDIDTFTNPVAATGFTNTICAKNTCKAWGILELNGSGTPDIIDGFNITNVAADGTSGVVSVDFVNNLADDKICVSTGFYLDSVSSVGTIPPGQLFPITLWVVSVSGAAVGFKMATLTGSGSFIDPTDATSSPTGVSGARIMFQVYGKQS